MAALNVLPGFLILASLMLFITHMWVVHDAIHRIAYEYAVAVPEPDTDQPVRDMLGSATTRVVRGRLAFHEGETIRISYRTNDDKGATLSDVQFPSEGYVQALLKETPSASIPGLFLLTAPFLAAFLCAVAAFVLMGLKDYVQEVLGIDERAVLSNVS